MLRFTKSGTIPENRPLHCEGTPSREMTNHEMRGVQKLHPRLFPQRILNVFGISAHAHFDLCGRSS